MLEAVNKMFSSYKTVFYHIFSKEETIISGILEFFK